MSVDRTAIAPGTTAGRLRGSIVSQDARERVTALATTYWEVATYLLIMAVAAILRFFQLGNRALHHDESLHAYYGHELAEGFRQFFTLGTANIDTWKHVPFMHGPFQFVGNGIVMWLFGSGDYQSRILAATMGTLLVGMPFLLRRQLGVIGALATATFIAFSPTLLYYSRFTREDIYTAFWTFGLVIFMWRYLATKQERYMYLSAGFMSGLFLTKEVSYFFVASFLIFMSYLLAAELATKMREQNKDTSSVVYAIQVVAFTALGPLIVVFWRPLRDMRSRYGIDEMPASGQLLICLGSIAIVCYAAFLQMALGDEWALRAGGADSHIAGAERGFALTTIFLLFGASLAMGLTWRPRTWLIAAATFWVPYVLLSTTFLTNLPGFWSVLWGSLDYWISQQDVARGNQPPFYYFMTIPVYEFLPLAVSAIALFYYGIQGDRARAMIVCGATALIIVCLLLPPGPVFFGRDTAEGGKEGASLFHVYIPFGIVLLLTMSLPMEDFNRFLIFWLVTTALALTVASEKMPWLNVHIALALCVLAGKFVGDLLSRGDLREDLPVLEKFAPFIYAATAAALCILVFTLVGPFAPASFGAWALAGVAAVSVYWAFSGYSPRTALQVAAVGAIAAFGVFTVRASVLASWGHPDNPFVGQPGDVAQRDYGEVPTELLVYTQTSGDIPILLDKIREYARTTGKGDMLPIVVDASDGYTWPWAWYLRSPEFKSVQYPALDANFTPPEGAVILASKNTASSLKLPPGAYEPGIEYHHRRWFDEKYRGEFKCDENGENCSQAYTTYDFFGDLFSPQLGYWIDFWVSRAGTPEDPYPYPSSEPGTTDGVAFFPAGSGVVDLTPTAPTVRTEGTQLVIGGKGFQNGQLDGPSNVTLDANGNMYVADTNNNRIAKYDANGVWLASAGGFGGDIVMNQPWSLAVADDGTVYVADTWNHRVVTLDSDLKEVTTWGVGGQTAAGGDPFALFGPRDITLTNDGNVLITDTGNHRLIEYTADGEFVRQFGQSGSSGAPLDLAEPVGVTVNDAGDIYIADYYNKRIVVLTSDLQERAIIPVQDWGSRGVTDRPYLALLDDGRLLVTVPNPCPDAPVGPPEGEVVCLSTTGTILVLDTSGQQISAFTVPTEGAETFARPIGVATDGTSVWVSDSQGSVVRKIPLSEIAP